MNAARKMLDYTTGHLQREARFADPAGTCNRDQAQVRAQQKISGSSDFLFPPYEDGPLHGKIRRTEIFRCLLGAGGCGNLSVAAFVIKLFEIVIQGSSRLVAEQGILLHRFGYDLLQFLRKLGVELPQRSGMFSEHSL